MPIPLERVSFINTRTAKLMNDYNKEYEECHNKVRQMQITAEISLVRLLISIINKPYIDLYRGKIPDDQLRMLGLLDEEE